jgi:hypothetical protein
MKEGRGRIADEPGRILKARPIIGGRPTKLFSKTVRASLPSERCTPTRKRKCA